MLGEADTDQNDEAVHVVPGERPQTQDVACNERLPCRVRGEGEQLIKLLHKHGPPLVMDIRTDVGNVDVRGHRENVLSWN